MRESKKRSKINQLSIIFHFIYCINDFIILDRLSIVFSNEFVVYEILVLHSFKRMLHLTHTLGNKFTIGTITSSQASRPLPVVIYRAIWALLDTNIISQIIIPEMILSVNNKMIPLEMIETNYSWISKKRDRF
jgi:hypothetical protein